MSNLGSKTPVSRLQEYFVLRNKIPYYELIRNGVGTHKPEFTYRVQIGDCAEEGTGRSKQEAKHRAAEKLLKKLGIIDGKEDEEENEPAENYVGQLKNHCITFHFPEPKYYVEEEAGPSHSKTFKMVCCVSQLKDFGIGRTKKAAKHQAALAMLQHLKDVGSKTLECLTLKEASSQRALPSLTDEEIFEKFNELRSTDPFNVKDHAALYKDNHNAYICLPKMSPTLSRVLHDNEMMCKENCLNLMEEIATELGVKLIKTVIPSKETDKNFTIITLPFIPSAAAIGCNESEAAFSLLNSFLVLCRPLVGIRWQVLPIGVEIPAL